MAAAGADACSTTTSLSGAAARPPMNISIDVPMIMIRREASTSAVMASQDLRGAFMKRFVTGSRTGRATRNPCVLERELLISTVRRRESEPVNQQNERSPGVAMRCGCSGRDEHG